jgi:lysophospholipase L1-like esterase
MDEIVASTALRAAYGLSVASTVTASGALVVGKHNPVDATAGAKTMTLPTGAGEGTTIGVEKLDSSANAVTVTGNVRGASGQSITLPWAHETLLLRADATGSWWPVAGHKTKTSLDAAYRGQRNKTIAIGDSITAGPNGTLEGADANNRYLDAGSWFWQACARSGQRIRYWWNAGKSGDDTSQIIARLDADVIARQPDRCIVLAGSNDYPAGFTPAQTRANLTTIYDRLQAANIQPILCSILPRNGHPYTATVGINTWMRAEAGRRGVPFIDLYSVIVDPATGNPATGMTTDGIHPYTVQGTTAIVNKILADLPSQYPTWTPAVAQANGDTTNLLANGLFTTDATADGLADSWGTEAGSITGITASLVDVTGWLGKAQQLVRPAAGSGSYLRSQAVASGWAAGDRISFSGKVDTSGIEAAAGNITVYLLYSTFTPSKTLRPVHSLKLDVTDATFYAEDVIPAGTTALKVIWGYNNANGGTVRFGQFALRNLTALGVA